MHPIHSKQWVDFEGNDVFRINHGYVDYQNEFASSAVLVTDYSSVFFDCSILGRPIIFYMYDLEEYAGELRGFYLSLDELPGPIVRDEDALIKEIRAADSWTADEAYKNFVRKYNPYEDGDSARRVLARVIER